MLSLNLRPIFKMRGISEPFSYLTKAGFTNHTAHRLLNSHNRNFSLDAIEKLCELLICEPNDLLAWTPNKNTTVRNDHPLYLLKPMADEDNGLGYARDNLSYKELKLISKKVKSDYIDNQKPKTENDLNSKE
ncbi:helix-turn-helix transcriptional regulator [Subsaxibacter sp. CAU 1640]|uniref:helix-turn-helix domain-containing protein n=1 Tax=Subsaxibacter sp. CAU 1640 TaxID=2933271 RepID=UPI002003DAE1|nr:helix-turn-helix transcriptional regulator [Subsaxibacter sp. CAU 1640]MCK7591144.1 helix-turn-helix transcriptional regulator [Subsaxibacter sp. CAU 1640]